MAAVRQETLSRELFESKTSAELEQEQEQELPKRSELLPGSALFPQRLLQLQDVPKKLFALGNIDVLNTPTIAIVGARKATAYGLECAARFARRAAALGVTVVSGGAIGCDMAAHQGALDAGGKTVVVLGSGADVVYPLRARGLFREVLHSGGVLLSEAPWGSPPLSWAFSKRNRIIAALADATLIVEAGLPSGTFQTADHTLALGNELMVVPGPIFSKESKGSNQLMLQGALPVIDDDSFEDYLAQLFGSRNQGGSSSSSSSSSSSVGDNKAMCAQRTGEEGAEEGRQDKGSRAKCAATEDRGANDRGAEGVAAGGAAAKDTRAEGVGAKGSANISSQELRLSHLRELVLKDLSAQSMSIDALAQARNRDTVEIIRVVSKLEVQGQIERLRDGRYMTKPGKEKI